MSDIHKNKIEIIEFLRFIAALFVVFVHIPVFGFGSFGVDIFFIISGFVMMYSTENNYKNFFLKRLIRILPSYYLFTFGVFIIALNFPNVLNNTTANLDHLLKSIFFIPFDKNGTGHFPILFLGWTLNYEMFFYSLFALSLLINNKFRSIFTSYAILAIFILCNSVKNYPLFAYGDLIVFEFILGIITYELIFKKNYFNSILILLTILIGLMISDVNTYNHRLITYGFPIAFAFSLIIFKFKSIKLPSLFLILGESSYALYLTHPYIIQFFDKITGWYSGNLFQKNLAVFLCILFTNLFAVLIYRCYELPIRNFLRKRIA